MKRNTDGHTKPRPEEVAQFQGLTLHQLGRLLAAGKIAFRKKEAEAKAQRTLPRHK